MEGEQILFQARILVVADVVEAMYHHRPYRLAIGLDSAIEEIKQNSGKLYQADVVDACVRLLQDERFVFANLQDES
ncbi:MAG: hypothetical protein P9M14_03085 [Candidatus Alcyoniella australis]|nr:hypothetical protein [Candidatus Alcyoniella australis]